MSERIDEGFSTTVEFANFPTVKFWEKTVTPPGVDGGGENDTSTMRNLLWRTRVPKKLKTLSEASIVVAYDPEVYDSIVDMVNDNQLITITFPDGDTVAFWGWVNAFNPGELAEGSQPTATVAIIPSNQDDDGNEVAPVWAAAA